MKVQHDKIQDQTRTTTHPVQHPPGTGGRATIVDNRPSTVYQRKLQESMRAYVAGSTSPIQRKPKGSTRFQQIASAMGEQYGVDTSGLKATHHSSFPKELHAEATIQGNNIHFAPGRDTNYNIRHEVAHAIDNTLNGTPKGDKVVNGQSVDTTRERVVDRMAQKPVNFLTRLKTPGNAGVIGSGSLQAKSIMTDQLPLKSRGISFSTPPVQRFDPSEGKDAQYDMIKDHTSTKDFLAYQENFTS